LKRDNLYLQFYNQILSKACEARLLIDRRKRLMDMISQMGSDLRNEENNSRKNKNYREKKIKIK
jgi:hypothetical protein